MGMYLGRMYDKIIDRVLSYIRAAIRLLEEYLRSPL